jgi:hypothetical protein
MKAEGGPGGHHLSKARLIPPVVAVVLMAGAGAAFAYFAAAGSGTASVSTGSLTISILGAGTPTNPLLPGGTGDVAVMVRNPNSGPVTVVSVTGDGPITASGGAGTCTTTGVSFTDQTGLSIPISAGASKPINLAGAVSMDTTAQNGCQGATFSIPVTVTVRS